MQASQPSPGLRVLLRASAFGSADQLWTVVIEWWIYVEFGIIALLDRRWPRIFMITLSVFAMMAPVYLLFKGNGLLLSWIVGMAGALLHVELSRVPRGILAMCASLCAGVGIWFAVSTHYNLYHPMFAVSFAMFLMSLHFLFIRATWPAMSGMWFKKLIVSLSEISYSVYLVHLSVLLWTMAWKPQFQGNPLMLLCLFVVANAASVIFYFAFERHCLVIRYWLGKFILRHDSVDKRTG